MQEAVTAATEVAEFGALTSLVQAVGAITSAALAIGLSWRRGGQWIPHQEDLPKAAERVGGVLTAVLIALLWAQFNAHAHLPFLNRVALVGAVLALASFLVYGFLVALQTYRQDVSTTKKEKFIKIVGGFWLTPVAQSRVASGSDVQSLFKDAGYNADQIWTRGGRALAQGLFALFFILLTSSGTLALSAAAMVYLIKQSPAPPTPPASLSGLSFVIPETMSRAFGSGTPTAGFKGYRVSINGALVGEVLTSDVSAGGHFTFDAVAGNRTVTIENTDSGRWTCPIELSSSSTIYGITSVSNGDCSAGAISKQAYDEFLARRKGAADATLTLTFEGTADRLVREAAPTSSRTPDNNENRGSCPNEVGREDGRYCISRTVATLTTVPPRFWRNAKATCTGSGCPWSRNGTPTISADGLSVTGYIDNWGSAVDIVLTADEFTRVTAQDCGPDVALKASTIQAARFSFQKQCGGIAIVKWTLPDGRAGSFPAGQQRSSGGEIVMDGEPSDQGTTLVVSYRRAG